MPFRALALRYGADTVFTEEVIDRRVVNAVRTENPLLGTVDYVESRGKKGNAIPFQTCPALERNRVVYQVGTGDAVNALRAAQVCIYMRECVSYTSYDICIHHLHVFSPLAGLFFSVVTAFVFIAFSPAAHSGDRSIGAQS